MQDISWGLAKIEALAGALPREAPNALGNVPEYLRLFDDGRVSIY